MSEESDGGSPRSFLVIGIVALVWNLFGVMSYMMHVTMSPEALAQMAEAEKVLLESSPAWTTGIFAISVFSGLLGCVGLLLKKAWAAPVFLVSLLSIIVQFGHWLFLTEAMEVYGTEAVIMPLLVTAAAVFLVWYSRNAKSKGWLS